MPREAGLTKGEGHPYLLRALRLVPPPMDGWHRMKTRDDIENYLIGLDLPFERVGDGMWLVYDEVDHIENLVLYLSGPVISLRVKLFELPPEPTPALYRKLLELNSSDMVHGAYAIEDDAVVIVAAHELENLDPNELRATIESIGLAISGHHQLLGAYLQSSSPAGA